MKTIISQLNNSTSVFLAFSVFYPFPHNIHLVITQLHHTMFLIFVNLLDSYV